MTLLALDRVGKRTRRGSHVVLEDVSLEVGTGEMVVVWGERQSGRSTLLRIAAGVEAPGSGVVRFEGLDLAERGGERLGKGISYCRRVFRPYGGRTVLDQLMSCQWARGTSQTTAMTNALKALERVDASSYAPYPVAGLKSAEEMMRVAIARALTSTPRLMVVDEPTIGVDQLKRDDILKLLRSLADDGITILATAGDGPGLLGADRILSLAQGKLHGDLTPDLAPVADLSHHRQARG